MSQGDARARDTVVVGASAGGVTAIRSFLSTLDTGLDASILIAIHRGPNPLSKLTTVLGRGCRLHVREPAHGDRLEPDVVYVASSDVHMRIDGSRILLDRGPLEHHTRPAIDPLFVSAALTRGERTIGVLLSGNLTDGVAGLLAIKTHGGVSLVQDPAEAEWPSMPRTAILHDRADAVFRTSALAPLLRELTRGASVARAVQEVAAGR